MGYANHGGQSKKYRTAHIINSDICGNVHKPCSVGIGGGKNEKITQSSYRGKAQLHKSAKPSADIRLQK